MSDEISVNLQDGDILVYGAAFATAKETEEWKALWTARRMFETNNKLSGCTHYLGFLTDSAANFRLERATTWPYKGGRPTEKPPWFYQIRKYYESLYQEVSGIEADDALTIAAEHYRELGIEVACSTKDKDLKQYPWKKFVDMNTDKVYSISTAQAHRNKWKQMLIGDVKVDNIPGLSHGAKYETTVEFDKKVRGATDLLVGATGAETLLDLWNPEDYCVKVYEMYLDAYEGNEPNCDKSRGICEAKGWTFGEYRFHETWDLIHMLLSLPEGVAMHYNHVEVTVGQAGPKMTNEFSDVSGDM